MFAARIKMAAVKTAFPFARGSNGLLVSIQTRCAGKSGRRSDMKTQRTPAHTSQLS